MADRSTSKRGAGTAGMADDALVALAHAGDKAAVDELYRRHAGAARRTARAILGSRQEADDVVADAFLGVLRAIESGAGPRDNFRAYLLACVRNGCKMTWRATRSVPRDPVQFDDGSFVFEDPERYVEAGIVAAAFSSLSPCWQQTLWLTAVEGKGTEEVARQLRRSPSAVPALALRAREAFAEAYLTQHVARAESDQCRKIAPKLAGYVRDHIGHGDRARVDAHLAECAACTDAADGLRDVNSCLRSLTLPLGLGALATSGVGAAAGGATVAGAVSIGVAGTGVSGAGLGALLVKIAAVAALAGPVLVYETTHTALSAPGPATATASASAEVDGARGAADGSVDVELAAPGGDGALGGDASVGRAPEEPGGGGSDGGSPPAPSSPTPPSPGSDLPSFPELMGDLTQPGSLSVNTGGGMVTSPLPLPIGLGAVLASNESTSIFGAGADVIGLGAAAVAVVGPEDLSAIGNVALPAGLGDIGVVAHAGADGVTVGAPAVGAGSVPAVTVPVPVPVAPVVGPVLGTAIGAVDPLLGPTIGLASGLIGQR